TWDDALQDALAERHGAAHARLLWSIWGTFLPDHYKGYTAPAVAATDIALPMLEDLGLRVIEEISTRLTGDSEAWVQEFRVLGPGGEPLAIDAVGDRV